MTKSSLNRRDMISGLMALSGAGMLAACGDQSPARSNVRPENISYPIGSPKHRLTYGETHKRMLRELVDIIIPSTDSPGGIAAGVPERLEKVLFEWMTPEARTDWVGRFNGVESVLGAMMPSSFLAAQRADRVEAVKTLDAAAYSGGGAGSDEYKRLKIEIATAYYTSEIGCTEELQYLAVPGEWNSCVPLVQIGRTWAV